MQKLRFQIFLVLSFSLLTSFFYSQINLVPNPSFETYTACPSSTAGGLITLATNWLNFGNSPDYFNTCASITFSLRGVPSNEEGYQNPKAGNGYGGIVTYLSGYREYIGIALTQTLSIGTKYFVSAYISRADTFPYTCSSNRFGFRFSTIPFSPTTSVLVDNFSHISTSSIITDSLGWTKVSGSFLADSAYQYFIIGNFYDDLNTNTIQCNYSISTAYYYIDQTCVSTDSMLCNVSTSTDALFIRDRILIYPNPSINEINIDLPLVPIESSIKLYNIYGVEILTDELRGIRNKLDISSIENGILLLKIKYQNEYYNYKLIKK